MKILYIDQSGVLGGGEIALLPWLERNARQDRVVLLQDGPFRTRLEENGVPVTVLPMDTSAIRRESGVSSILAAVPQLLSLRKRFRALAQQADLIYANSQKAFLLAAASKRRGQPLVWHLRDILSAEHFSAIIRRIAVFFGDRFATAIIANSEATAEAYSAAGGRRDLVTVVYDGVSATPFDAPSDTGFISRFRAEHGIGDRPLIGLFSRLSEWKGQHILLEAVARIPDVHVALIGDALFGEHDYVERIRQRAQMPDLAGRVHFLGFQSDVPRLMLTMDIIVHCSVSPEPFGLVIVEGMLARRPVIAANAGGAREIIVDGASGILCTPGDVAELSDSILSLLQDPAKAKRLAEAGRQRAESRFSLEQCFEGIRAVLTQAKSV